VAIPLKIGGHDNAKVFMLLTASYWSTIDSVMPHIVSGRITIDSVMLHIVSGRITIDSVMLHIVSGHIRGHRRLSLCSGVIQSVVDFARGDILSH